MAPQLPQNWLVFSDGSLHVFFAHNNIFLVLSLCSFLQRIVLAMFTCALEWSPVTMLTNVGV